MRISDWSSDVCSSDLEFFRVLLSLTDADAVERIPSTRFLDDAGLDAEVDDLAETRNAFAVHDIEFDLFERRRDLVLHHLDAGRVADDVFTDFDRAGAADIETHRCIEFERVAAGRGFGVAVHHADLHAQRSEEHTSELQSLM